MTLYLIASLLARGRQLERLSDGIALLALAYGLAPLLGLPLHPLASALCLALVALGLAHKYWAVRVALDAELFAHLASQGADAQALDAALFELRLKPQPCDLRDWPTRGRAALALLRRQALCLALQVTLALATLITLPFSG